MNTATSRILCLGLLLLAGIALAAAGRCDLCGKSISGRYLNYRSESGRTLSVCETCNRTKPRCQVCRIPVAKASPLGQATVCGECARHLHRCTICNSISPTKYDVYNINGIEYYVCPACSRTKPRCSGCNVPVNPDYLRTFPNGKKWCSLCLKKSEPCTGCGNPISGKYYKLEYVDGAWCATCYEMGAKCQTCQKPITQKPFKTPDGRIMCSSCSQTTISGTERYQQIASQVRASVGKLMGRPVPVLPVRVVGIDELRVLFAEGGIKTSEHTDPHGFVEEMGLFRVKGTLQEIVVLDSMPEDMVWETLAHEMAHAWQEAYYPQCTEMVLSEGFAQWTAEQICVQYKRESTLQRLRSRQDLYGRGYRLFTNLEIRGGRELIVKTLKENRLVE